MNFLEEGKDRRVTLEQWIDEISRDPDLGVISAIQCRHLVADSLGDEVAGVVVQSGKEWSPKKVSELFMGRAKVFSQDLGGIQKFKVQAYFGRAEPSATMHFTVSGRTSYHGETEQSDSKGLLSQGMRLGELVVQRSFAKDSELWDVTKYLLAETKRDRDYYHGRCLEAEQVVMKLVKDQIAANNEQRMRELEFARSTEERRKLIMLLPAIVSHFTGHKIVSEGQADTAILETVAQHVRKMPPDVQGKIMSVIPAELQIILGARLKEIGERQSAEEEAIRSLASAKTKDQKEADEQIVQALESDLEPRRLQ